MRPDSEDYPLEEMKNLIGALCELQQAGVKVIEAAKAYRLALEMLRDRADGSDGSGRLFSFNSVFRA